MKTALYFTLLIISATSLSAQEATPVQKKIQYFFSVNSGLLAGEKRASAITYTASTVHGITIGKRLRAGAGFGFDSYSNWQALPLFGQASYDVLGKKNAVFIEFSYGWSHAWMQKEQWAPATTDQGGRMVNSMIGYRIASGTLRVSVTAGYKYQHVMSDYSYQYDFFPTSYGYRAEENFQRLVLTVGLGWR